MDFLQRENFQRVNFPLWQYRVPIFLITWFILEKMRRAVRSRKQTMRNRRGHVAVPKNAAVIVSILVKQALLSKNLSFYLVENQFLAEDY
jgi:hypothetical protein